MTADRSSPLRVLFLITDLSKGGAERFLIDLSTALQARDDVELIIGSLYEANEYGELAEGLPIEHLQYSTFSLRRGGVCPRYQDLLRRFRPHVVHTHRYLAEFLSSYYVSEDIAYVCHGHDNMVQLASATWRSVGSRGAVANIFEKRHLVREKYRKARTWFIANSTHTLAYYRRVLPASMKGDVHLIPYGFAYNRFRRRDARASRDGEPIRLLNVGSFQDKKNQIFLVDIAQELRRQGVDFEVHLLGDGENRAAVEDAVAAAGLSEQMFLHGNVDRVEEWMWNSDIYLHTAWYEPFGLVFLEAMAAGLPCVTLDGKGNKDLIEEGKNGYLVETQDPRIFAERILRLSTDQALYGAISAYAQDFAKGYDIATATDTMVAFYRSCVDFVGGAPDEEST